MEDNTLGGTEMTTNNNILPHLRLKFHVDHPGLEECWAEGYEAAQLNQPEESNPYTDNTTEFQHWNEGWWSGFYEEEPITELTSKRELTPPAFTEITEVAVRPAANESHWTGADVKTYAKRVAKIAGAIAATGVVVYQILDIVA